MISSEMSEIIGMSNRVMVMCDGRITGFIDGKDATQENIMLWRPSSRPRPKRRRPISKQGGCLSWKLPRK